ncbi:hypothetical protein M422DRAFT_38550 [Sphaerobolus stellatus SS14]|uniref:Uncharacterized protein n=1 Tax=Sphaerobolus stellatus (strain SS14) TaxID=990650 RepID=A0A0C9U9D3_SPHS4|nr:hypothetical protein M422DRAFT_38550 [Sphaerobolus stellatus SS14]
MICSVIGTRREAEQVTEDQSGAEGKCLGERSDEVRSALHIEDIDYRESIEILGGVPLSRYVLFHPLTCNSIFIGS